MTNRHRIELRRQIAQAYHNVDRAILDAKELIDMFNPIHPEEAEYLVNSVTLLILAQDLMEQFSIKAWNFDRTQYEIYRT